MLSFEEILRLAIQKKGSKSAVLDNLPEYLTAKALKKKTDDRFLSDMSRRVFQAGLSWKMVNNKWPAFEERFFGFNPQRCAFISPEEMEAFMRNKTLIRHLDKMKSIQLNAFMMTDIARDHGSFGTWLADWPENDIVGLWLYLKKHGCRLGGNSGPIFLRVAGKDTFILSDDVVAALINYKVVDKKPTSQKALREVQERFNAWHEESGRPMCEISRILSMTV